MKGDIPKVSVGLGSDVPAHEAFGDPLVETVASVPSASTPYPRPQLPFSFPWWSHRQASFLLIFTLSISPRLLE